MTAVWKSHCIVLEGRRKPWEIEADLIDLSVQTEFLWTADPLKGFRNAFGPRRMFLGKYGFVQVLWDGETMAHSSPPRKPIDEQRAIIESVRGVAYTHCDRDGLPQQVRPGEVALLRRLIAKAAKEALKPERERRAVMLFDPETPILFTGGPFTSFRGFYMHPLPNGQERCEVEIFGRRTSTEVSASEIEEDKSRERATA